MEEDAPVLYQMVYFSDHHGHINPSVRKFVENQRLEAVISMPSGVFKPYAGVSTATSFLQKQNTVEQIRYGSTI